MSMKPVPAKFYAVTCVYYTGVDTHSHNSLADAESYIIHDMSSEEQSRVLNIIEIDTSTGVPTLLMNADEVERMIDENRGEDPENWNEQGWQADREDRMGA